MNHFQITTVAGRRQWHADDAQHALDQHHEAMPDEHVKYIYIECLGPCPHPDHPELC